jgi:hypothetical protein
VSAHELNHAAAADVCRADPQVSVFVLLYEYSKASKLGVPVTSAKRSAWLAGAASVGVRKESRTTLFSAPPIHLFFSPRM